MSERILPFPKIERKTLERFDWLREVFSADGPTSPSARLVAATLGMRMRANLSGCFPSQATIAAESGLSERTVRTSLKELEAGGWLVIVKEKGSSKWVHSVYLPRLPDRRRLPQTAEHSRDLANAREPSRGSP